MHSEEFPFSFFSQHDSPFALSFSTRHCFSFFLHQLRGSNYEGHVPYGYMWLVDLWGWHMMVCMDTSLMSRIICMG
jgi:hypothetical protein